MNAVLVIVIMADPTLQTYCCHHHVHTTEMAVRIMREFDTDAYNAVCMVSSIVGILGASYQVRYHVEKQDLHKKTA